MSVVSLDSPPPAPLGAKIRPWGWSVRGQVAGGRGRILDVAASMLGCALCFFAVALWISPGSLTSMDVLPAKLGATVLASLAAIYLVRLKPKFDAPEIQVDLSRGEVRVISRTYRSDVLREVHGFSEIEGIEVVAQTLMLVRPDGTRHRLLEIAGSSQISGSNGALPVRAHSHTNC